MSAEKSVALTDEDLAQFDWLNLHREMDEALPRESKSEKFIRKCTENPFVPIGTLATTAALSYGIVSFRKGDRQMSQYMMRTRVAAQGFTIAAIVIGFVLSVGKK